MKLLPFILVGVAIGLFIDVSLFNGPHAKEMVFATMLVWLNGWASLKIMASVGQMSSHDFVQKGLVQNGIRIGLLFFIILLALVSGYLHAPAFVMTLMAGYFTTLAGEVYLIQKTK